MPKPLFIWQDKTLIQINPEEIACLSTEKNYTRIFMTDDSYFMVRSTLSNAAKKLPPDMFIKIHRSYVVSLRHISSIFKDHVLVFSHPVPVARQYYQSLLKRVSIIR
jgi:DNA-binding LytR/AlgR family response regulator